MIPVTIPKTNPQNIAPISQYLRDVPNRTFAISRSCRWLSSTLPAAMLGGNRIRLGLEGLAIKSQRFIRLSFPHQLLPLFDELRLLLLGRRLSKERSQRTEHRAMPKQSHRWSLFATY